jgi:secreted Zn-dependent insulinase-like peptidase
VYNEIRDASAVAFQFKEKSPNYQYSTELSSSMHHVDLKDVISWRANYADFDQALIDGFLRQLNPFNLLLVYSNSEELEDPIVEKHLGGNFVIRDLPARVNEGVTFHPLRKNPFLPLSTALTPADPV